MTKGLQAGISRRNLPGKKAGIAQRLRMASLGAVGFAVLTALTSCQTDQVVAPVEPAANHSEAISLREGDVVKIAFPGAPSLDTTQQIRRDGKITLSPVGELAVVGMTPAELEKEVLKLYSAQLVSKEVVVTVVSSSFPVFVTGAVIKPGKILSDHPITALEAIMEAGGFDYTKANLKAVVVVRNEEGHVRNYTLNLKLALQGKQSEPFYLKASDIIYVPEKFNWF
jgi:polysaccharide biosynthesis/export protein